MGISNCDNVVEVMKTLEVVIKMHSSFSKNVNFPQNFVKWQQKLEFSEIIFKVDPTKRENASKKLSRISFVTWAVQKTQTFEWMLYVWTAKLFGN